MAQFGTKIGLIAATVGSAVGLGNIWRFPDVVQSSGGGAFLIVYLFCVLLLGIPVMLGEFVVGRNGRTDAIGDYKKLEPKRPWWMVGATGLIASYLILCFYTVVAGWTLEYLVNSCTGNLFAGVSDAATSEEVFNVQMQNYIETDVAPIVYTLIGLVISGIVLMLGVQKGIERVSNIMMPSLFLVLVIFLIASLSLPGAGKGVQFFLQPDFSKITPSVIVSALGQAFFSLSLGMGVLITYSAYYSNSTNLVKTATTVSLLDLMVSVMMGLIIFPAVASFGMMDAGISGKTLVFVTMPAIFEQMPGTQIWAILFFILLLFAALTSIISIAEVTVRFFQDRCRMKRYKAVLVTIVPLMLFGSICSLSEGSWSNITLFGLNIFSLLDYFASNILLPLGSLFMCIYLGWFAPKTLLKKELTNESTIRCRLLSAITFLIKWVAPVAITLVFISTFI